MKRLAILGASGHGKVVADSALAQGWESVVFFDDSWPSQSTCGSWPVIGNTDALVSERETYDGAVVAIGNNGTRQKKVEGLKKWGVPLVTVVHPSAVVSESAEVGEATVILANATVNADAVVGSGAIINTGAVVEHDCILGEFSHVSPNAVLAGGVRAGVRVWVGSGASVRQSIVIGDDAILGMGCVVVTPVKAGTTVIGVPAQIYQSSS